MALLASLGITAIREFIFESIHPFRVTQIDVSTGTMRLVHGNRIYVVRCQEDCGEFRTASRYAMKDMGGWLECVAGGRNIRLSIMEEKITFDPGGGHG
ncbi:MAG: hypothetical protein JO249_06220 [Acidobacteria bacterium]|nr:hypothetical protein [Acidobacteriota bacterium]